MRIAFLGSQSIGASCLQVVLDHGHDVVGVATFSPEEHETWSDEVACLVERHRLPRLDVRRFRDPAELQALYDVRPDLTLVVGWRWLLPPDALSVAPLGTIGVHGSLLPRLRGFAPVNWALIRDEPRTGPTLFYINDGLDTGDVLAARPFAITDADDASTIRARIEDESASMLADLLPLIAHGDAPRTEQQHDLATYGERRRPSDGLIDWAANARDVFNLVRGVTRPYPGAFTHLEEQNWRVWRVALVAGAPGKPGTVHRWTHNGEPRVVAASDGLLELVDIEPIP